MSETFGHIVVGNCYACGHFPTQIIDGRVTVLDGEEGFTDRMVYKALPQLSDNTKDVLGNFLGLLKLATENDPTSDTFELRLGRDAIGWLIEALESASAAESVNARLKDRVRSNRGADEVDAST